MPWESGETCSRRVALLIAMSVLMKAASRQAIQLSIEYIAHLPLPVVPPVKRNMQMCSSVSSSTSLSSSEAASTSAQKLCTPGRAACSAEGGSITTIAQPWLLNMA
ncbi:hypothetical protein D3C84_958980 [compost metagenome]